MEEGMARAAGDLVVSGGSTRRFQVLGFEVYAVTRFVFGRRNSISISKGR
jgi:hypothetical protein